MIQIHWKIYLDGKGIVGKILLSINIKYTDMIFNGRTETKQQQQQQQETQNFTIFLQEKIEKKDRKKMHFILTQEIRLFFIHSSLSFYIHSFFYHLFLPATHKVFSIFLFFLYSSFPPIPPEKKLKAFFCCYRFLVGNIDNIEYERLDQIEIDQTNEQKKNKIGFNYNNADNNKKKKE